MAFTPGENLVAIAEAPPTIDATLEAAYHIAGIYFPFTDAIVADPYGDIAKDLELAFYIGQSAVVGGIKTDMVAYASHGVFVQMWIGAQDKLPRRARAVFRNDPQRLRHQVDMSNWKLDGDIPAGAFASARAAAAKRIPFAHPNAGPPPGAALHPKLSRQRRPRHGKDTDHEEEDRQRPRGAGHHRPLVRAGRGLVALRRVR